MKDYRKNDRGSVAAEFGVGIAALLALALLAVVIFGGWLLGWWFKTQNTNREARLYQHQYGYQSTLREEVSNKFEVITNINVQLTQATGSDEINVLKAQRLAVGQIICRDAAQIDAVDQLPTDQGIWVAQNCASGSVTETSGLRK